MKGSNTDPSRLFVVNTSIPWLATVTGRIGFTASPAVLLYAKGGGAWVRDNYTLTVVGGTTLATANSTSSGWTVGGVVEWSFAGNWSAFAVSRSSQRFSSACNSARPLAFLSGIGRLST
jgi:outer membrane immunogenic protein